MESRQNDRLICSCNGLVRRHCSSILGTNESDISSPGERIEVDRPESSCAGLGGRPFAPMGRLTPSASRQTVRSTLSVTGLEDFSLPRVATDRRLGINKNLTASRSIVHGSTSPNTFGSFRVCHALAKVDVLADDLLSERVFAHRIDRSANVDRPLSVLCILSLASFLRIVRSVGTCTIFLLITCCTALQNGHTRLGESATLHRNGTARKGQDDLVCKCFWGPLPL